VIEISLVTPSYNKAAYLEAALASVLSQAYPSLDYGVVDGGSQDDSLEILSRYQDRLSYLISEPDRGMYDALSKGFNRSRGEIMGYLGADDLHMPWTLSVVAEIFERFPDVQWLTTLYPLTADAQGRVLKARELPPPSSRTFQNGGNLPGFSWWSAGWIQQESTFWRRSLWEKAGGLDPSLRHAGDFDLWCRFFKLAEPVGVAAPLAAFRRHGDQISGTHGQAYRSEALDILRRHGGKPGGRYSSRLFEALRRIGASPSGRVARYDFAEGDWRLHAL
jgi:glycosyltransferase involved in cell wall biosynthesis